MMRTHVLAAVAATAVAAAACGGGGGSSVSPSAPAGNAPPSTAPASGSRTVGLSFGGTSTLAGRRSTLDLNQTPVTVTYNGAVVGAGTIDQNGRAKISLKNVPAGATLHVIAGKVTATVVLAMSATATAVLVMVNSDGTLTVTAAADPNNTGNVTPDEDEQQNEHEDMNGNILDVDNMQANVLPANLPFTLANTCSTITLTPTNAADASVEFEEKNDDNDNNASDAKVHFEGAFTSALQFPLIAGSTRIHVQVFDASRKQISEVKAPIGAFSVGATGTCPSPAPAPGLPTPTAAPTSAPTATASPDDRPSPSPSPTATASSTPH